MSEIAVSGHGGQLAVAAACRAGVTTMWTLSGAHIFPLLDAAVGGLDGGGPLRLVDVRHEQTAAFAAEAMGKLTRIPGLAAVTAGPGVTNVVSAVTGAWFNGSPMVVLGGRSPDERWGTGALQELDQPPIFQTITKVSETVHDVTKIYDTVDRALVSAASAHRGPTFVDFPMDVLFSEATVSSSQAPTPDRSPQGDLEKVVSLLQSAKQPLLIIGSDVWADGAELAALTFVEHAKVPVVANGMARGVVPRTNRYLVTGARSRAIKEADLVVVVGSPLDFRLGYGNFRGLVVHIADSKEQVATHVTPAATAYGDLTQIFTLLTQQNFPSFSEWSKSLSESHQAAREKDRAMLESDSDPIHPGRIYGELLKVLDEDAVVIGDGGDFVSFAGRFVEPMKPGGWLDPGPYGCLGTGMGYAMAARVARPSSQVALLLGDGATGFSLMDVDSLVRHDLPAVMVVGNNGMWGLEKSPMQALFGYDVAADLQPTTRYDEVVKALGGAGEMVTSPDQIGQALKRAFDSGVPYLVNVITDSNAIYPRSTTGI